ncbi:DUF4124 domain-containing protein [Microbulbifer taiwanensis]|uniref:DUF4124 domain-containing protein n=2 Tax=Microbulbifer taiwanensis TaxID=986746 RepID=A0ABW1YLJ5_9GAMM|nr:DUF4124 domain-containing protein [Microbulbifer taiwanensis]
MIKTGMGVIALMLAATAGAGELYRWVDKDGKVHFSDRPPAEAAAENIEDELRPINTADATAPRDRSVRRQQANPQQEYENRQRQQQQERQQKVAQACNHARRELRMLQGRVAFIDGQGKEIKMTERERQQMAARLQGEIRRACG